MNAAHSPIYANMIAGCLPVSAITAPDALASQAGAIVRDPHLYMLSATDGDYVYYFGVASKWIRAAGQFGTPLAAALPGHPQHKGDGLYVYQAGVSTVAVLKRRQDFLLLNVDLDSLDQLAHDHQLAIHAVDAQTTNWPLIAATTNPGRMAITRVVERVATVCTRAIGACIALYVGLTLADVWLGQPEKVPPAAAAELVKRIQYVSPLSEQLAQIQKISSTVVRAGGWLEAYVWRQGKGEAFEITLPGWVSRDYIEALGPGTVTEQNLPDNLIIARKGNFEKMADKR